jgi:thioesterase domain-containing protein
LEEITALAARHLDALAAEIGPFSGSDARSAPVHLGGWSFGALVAFELARGLAARGGMPGVVVAIDAAPGAAAGDGTGADGEGDESALLVRALSEVAPVTAEELRGLELDQRVDLLLRRARERGALGPLGPECGGGAWREPMERATARRLLAVFTAALRAAGSWRPEPADLRVALLAAAQSDHLPADDPAAGWRRIARGGVEVVTVPGDHGSVLSPENAPAVARVLARLLNRADEATVSTRPTGGAG